MAGRTLKMALPSQVVYVAGTVNGQAAIWTLAGENIWETTVPRAESGRYEVSLLMIDEAGNEANAVFTLHYNELGLITWRTEADVQRAGYLNALWGPEGFTGTEAERQEWLSGGMIGAYNATDLNRVGAAVQYIANRLTECGYTVHVTSKTDWEIADLPQTGQMEIYLGNIAALRGVLALLPTTPPVPGDMEGLTYSEANDIEQILTDLNMLLGNMEEAFIYCGEVYCGDV